MSTFQPATAPTFETIASQTVLVSSPLHIPIDAYDPNGDPLTISVSVDDPTILEATVLSGNRSIRIDMDGFGDMVLQLFEQRAPVPSGRVIELAESDFYDDVIFHRVINNFMIQTGDRTGTGRFGSDLGTFDDQFHVDLQHNRAGVLSFAKSIDDSNDSQFFITETPRRQLDFNHSVFGQLVEGDDVREAISEMDTIDPMGDPSNDRPVVDIKISSIDVFSDTENGVIMLRAIGDEPATTSVTVRVSDSTGLFTQQSFDVTIAADTANSQPFFEPLNVPSQIYVNQTVVIDLPVIDIEGDPVIFQAATLSGSIELAAGSLDTENRTLTLTPAVDTTGPIEIGVLVAPHPDVVGNLPGDFDRQNFTINVVQPAPFYRFENPPDVDGSGGPSALDALLIINAMLHNGGEIDLSSGNFDGLSAEFKYNVNGDLRITALDALQVINALAAGEAELAAGQTGHASRLSLRDSGVAGNLRGTKRDDQKTIARIFANSAPLSWLPHRDEDDCDDLINLLAEFQLGLQSIA